MKKKNKKKRTNGFLALNSLKEGGGNPTGKEEVLTLATLNA